MHGSIEDIQGPRTSALGLEGMDEQTQHQYGGNGNGPNGQHQKGPGVGKGRNRAGTMGSMMSMMSGRGDAQGQSEAPTVRPSPRKTWYG